MLLLADVLERATPGQVIACSSLADGADCLVFRTGATAGGSPVAPPVGRTSWPADRVDLPDVLVWRGLLQREPPRRPDPDRPPRRRRAATRPGSTASSAPAAPTAAPATCRPSGCACSCRSVDQMERERLADVPGTIATFTVDRLAFSLSPPVVAAVIDFDGGGRFQCELTDVDPATVAIGDRVEMTFRRLYTQPTASTTTSGRPPLRSSGATRS